MGCAGAKVEISKSHSLNFSDLSRVALSSCKSHSNSCLHLVQDAERCFAQNELGMLICSASGVALKLFAPDLADSLRSSLGMLSPAPPFPAIVPGTKAPTSINMQEERLNIGEAGPKGEVYTGEHSDSIKWRESKGQCECILIECLQ